MDTSSSWDSSELSDSDSESVELSDSEAGNEEDSHVNADQSLARALSNARAKPRVFIDYNIQDAVAADLMTYLRRKRVYPVQVFDRRGLYPLVQSKHTFIRDTAVVGWVVNEGSWDMANLSQTDFYYAIGLAQQRLRCLHVPRPQNTSVVCQTENSPKVSRSARPNPLHVRRKVRRSSSKCMDWLHSPMSKNNDKALCATVLHHGLVLIHVVEDGGSALILHRQRCERNRDLSPSSLFLHIDYLTFSRCYRNVATAAEMDGLRAECAKVSPVHYEHQSKIAEDDSWRAFVRRSFTSTSPTDSGNRVYNDAIFEWKYKMREVFQKIHQSLLVTSEREIIIPEFNIAQPVSSKTQDSDSQSPYTLVENALEIAVQLNEASQSMQEALRSWPYCGRGQAVLREKDKIVVNSMSSPWLPSDPTYGCDVAGGEECPFAEERGFIVQLLMDWKKDNYIRLDKRICFCSGHCGPFAGAQCRSCKAYCPVNTVFPCEGRKKPNDSLEEVRMLRILEEKLFSDDLPQSPSNEEIKRNIAKVEEAVQMLSHSAELGLAPAMHLLGELVHHHGEKTINGRRETWAEHALNTRGSDNTLGKDSCKRQKREGCPHEESLAQGDSRSVSLRKKRELGEAESSNSKRPKAGKSDITSHENSLQSNTGNMSVGARMVGQRSGGKKRERNATNYGKHKSFTWQRCLDLPDEIKFEPNDPNYWFQKALLGDDHVGCLIALSRSRPMDSDGLKRVSNRLDMHTEPSFGLALRAIAAYTLGKQYYKMGEKESSIHFFTIAANSGHRIASFACCILAAMKKKFSDARDHCFRSAAAGFVPAMVLLGNTRHRLNYSSFSNVSKGTLCGEDVEVEDENDAVQLYKGAAIKGSAQAAIELLRSELVKEAQNKKMLEKVVLRAALNDRCPIALHNCIQLMRVTADGLPQLSQVELREGATKLQCLAADQEYAPALVKLACMELEQKNEHAVRKAVEYLRRAATMNEQEALIRLGDLALEGKIPRENVVDARRYYERGVKLHSSDCGLKVALLYEGNHPQIPRDEKKMVAYLSESVAQGNTDAMVLKARYLATGLKDALKKDVGEARRWIQQAMDRGNGEAWLRAGSFYVEGNVFARDMKTAIDHYKRAVALGNKLAELHLAAALLHAPLYLRRVGDARLILESFIEKENSLSKELLASARGIYAQVLRACAQKESRTSFTAEYQLGQTQLTNSSDSSVALTHLLKGMDEGDWHCAYQLALAKLRGDRFLGIEVDQRAALEIIKACLSKYVDIHVLELKPVTNLYAFRYWISQFLCLLAILIYQGLASPQDCEYEETTNFIDEVTDEALFLKEKLCGPPHAPQDTPKRRRLSTSETGSGSRRKGADHNEHRTRSSNIAKILDMVDRLPTEFKSMADSPQKEFRSLALHRAFPYMNLETYLIKPWKTISDSIAERIDGSEVDHWRDYLWFRLCFCEPVMRYRKRQAHKLPLAYVQIVGCDTVDSVESALAYRKKFASIQGVHGRRRSQRIQRDRRNERDIICDEEGSRNVENEEQRASLPFWSRTTMNQFYDYSAVKVRYEDMLKEEPSMNTVASDTTFCRYMTVSASIFDSRLSFLLLLCNKVGLIPVYCRLLTKIFFFVTFYYVQRFSAHTHHKDIIGTLYLDGFFLRRDLAEAFAQFVHGAEGLNVTACLYAGVMLCLGVGTEKDIVRGARFIRQAAEMGSVQAETFMYCCTIDESYGLQTLNENDGNSAHKRLASALQNTSLAGNTEKIETEDGQEAECEFGEGESDHRNRFLESVNIERYVEPDEAKIKSLRQGCNFFLAAWMCELGIGRREPDIEGALMLHKIGARLGSPASHAWLVANLLYGRGPLLPETEVVKESLQVCYRTEDTPGLLVLLQCFERSLFGLDVHPSFCEHLRQKLLRRRSMDAMLETACLSRVAGPLRDFTLDSHQSMLLYAAYRGHGPSMMEAAYRLSCEDSIETPNAELGERLYQKLKSLGGVDPDPRFLREMYEEGGHTPYPYVHAVVEIHEHERPGVVEPKSDAESIDRERVIEVFVNRDDPQRAELVRDDFNREDINRDDIDMEGIDRVGVLGELPDDLPMVGFLREDVQGEDFHGDGIHAAIREIHERIARMEAGVRANRR